MTHQRAMHYNSFFNRSLLLVVCVFALVAARCGSDPNLEGAKLDLDNKDYDRALENINKAIENDPVNAEAYALKGEILQEQLLDVSISPERTLLFEEMVDAYHNAVAIDAELDDEITSQMQTAFRNERYLAVQAYNGAQHAESENRADAFASAASLFHNASLIFPDSGTIYIDEANAYLSAGMFSNALDAYQGAIRSGLTDRTIYIRMASTLQLMADDHETADQRRALFRQAIQALLQGIESYSQDEEMQDMLLNLYAESELEEEALTFFRSQYDTKRGDKVYLYNYGTLLLRNHDYGEAAELLQEAVALDPSYTKALFNLGASLINEGVRLSQEYNDIATSLDQGNSTAGSESQLRRLDSDRQSLFSQAIVHLEEARRLADDSLEPSRDICRALFRAYGYSDQRTKAEEVRKCAEYES